MKFVLLAVVFALGRPCSGQYDPQRFGKGRIAPPGTKAGLPPVNLVEHGPYGAERPFVYNHVAKTGGSFVKNVLLGLFGKDVNILEEWNGIKALKLPTTGSTRPFIMGAIRAPCDYYLSLWSFTSGGVFDKVVGTVKEIRKYLGRDRSAGYATPDDIKRFRKWVNGLSSKSLNLLTARFWFSYFRVGNPCKVREGEVCAGVNSVFESMLSEIEGDLAGANLSDIADCWLRTEHLEADLRFCLQRYGQEVNATIDWQLFEELLAKKEKNKSDRQASCEEYYDEDTKNLVLTKDVHVVRLFGYDQCCAPPRNKSAIAKESAKYSYSYSYGYGKQSEL